MVHAVHWQSPRRFAGELVAFTKLVMESHGLANPSDRLTYCLAGLTKLETKLKGGHIMRSRNILMLIALSAAVAVGPTSVLGKPTRPEGASKSEVIHFTGLGEHTRSVRTSSPEAQKYFNQG